MDADDREILLHANCIAIEGGAALLLGPPGSGKSDLSLRLITSQWVFGDEIVRPVIVADDQVRIGLRDETPWGRCPDSIRGLIEVRGQDIASFSHRPEAPIRLVVELVNPVAIERLPDPGSQVTILGKPLPLLRLAPFEASAPAKLVLALYRLCNERLPSTR